MHPVKIFMYWNILCSRIKPHPINFVGIVQRLPTDLGYTDASELGGGQVWLDPNYDGTKFVWRLEWPNNIQDNLISFENPTKGITNSDLKPVDPVLHKATFYGVYKSSP